MPPEAENFLTDRFLKSIYKGQGNDHNGNTDHSGCYRQAYNKPWKGFLLIKCDATGYEGGNIHIIWLRSIRLQHVYPELLTSFANVKNRNSFLNTLFLNHNEVFIHSAIVGAYDGIFK